jgi:AcrR family transcriptional regulator
MSEQEIVGRRVEELGTGLYLAKEEVTAEKLRDSVQRLLAEARFGQQAASVRDSFQAAGVSRGRPTPSWRSRDGEGLYRRQVSLTRRVVTMLCAGELPESQRPVFSIPQ